MSRTTNLGANDTFERARATIAYDHDVGFVIQREQEITDDFRATMAEARDRTSSRNTRLPDVVLAATVPAIFVEKWLKDGFNIYREPAKAIVARLRRENLTEFLASDRQLV